MVEYIHIDRRLFLEDPALRFSRTFSCFPGVWREVWKRYKFLDYTKDEAREYLITTLHQPVSQERFNRWVMRTEVYTRAQIAVKTGAEKVKIEYFKPYTHFIIREITKNK